MCTKEEIKLIRKAIQGNPEALDELIQEKMAEIIYISQLFTDKNNRDDAVQEALYNIVKNIQKVKKPEYFNTWLFRVIKNACGANWHMNNKNYTNEVSIEDDDRTALFAEENIEFLPETFVLKEEKRKLIMECLNELPFQYKEVLILKYFKGLTHNEISETLEINSKIVYNRLARGKKNLKLLLEEKTAFTYPLKSLSVGSIPALAEVLKADSIEAVTGETIAHFIARAQEIIKESANQLTTTTMTTKIVMIGIGAVVVIGGAIGIWQLIGGEPPAIENAMPIEITNPAETPEGPQEIVIESLGDMIGESNAKQLMTYVESGTNDSSAWEAFLKAIEMTVESKGGDDEKTFAVFSLDKQDKRLMIAHLQTAGTIRVVYEFGEQKNISIPMDLEVVSLF